MISINNLKYEYPKFNVDFNCKITFSKTIGIIGKSGSGKSTLINLFSGFLVPISGQIILDKLDVTNLKPNERNLSVLFQDHNNFDHLSLYYLLLFSYCMNILIWL